MLASDDKVVVAADDEMQLSDSSVNHSQKQPKMSLETADFVYTPRSKQRLPKSEKNFSMICKQEESRSPLTTTNCYLVRSLQMI